MSQILRTITFFKVFLKQQFAEIEINQQHLIQADGSMLKFDEYIPAKKCLGTIVFTHGMTRLANQDQRIRNFCRAMATIGYRMLAPAYPHIKALDITVESISDIADSIRTFIRHGYTTNDKLALFSVSFSGAQALRAISEPDIAPHVSALLALGTASSYISTFKKILDPHGPAELYVKMLLLHNILLHSEHNYPEPLCSTINAAIDDAYENNNPENLKTYAEKLPDDLRQQYLTLLTKLTATDEIFTDNLKTIEKIEHAFLQTGDLSQLKTAVCLIHSDKDKVLMPCESEQLYSLLKASKVKTSLTITPLLDHVNAQFSLRRIKQAWQLVSGFNFFFNHAKANKR